MLFDLGLDGARMIDLALDEEQHPSCSGTLYSTLYWARMIDLGLDGGL